jgi:hypothetical protein
VTTPPAQPGRVLTFDPARLRPAWLLGVISSRHGRGRLGILALVSAFFA